MSVPMSMVFVVITMLTVQWTPMEAQAAVFRQGDELEIRGEFQEDLFAAGEKINAEIQSVDDVFFAAGEITTSGKTTENWFAAAGRIIAEQMQSRLATLVGGSITVSNGNYHDIILAAGTATLTRVQIEDDLIVAGGELKIGPEAEVGGSLVAAGGDVKISGVVKGSSDLAGGEVRLEGRFTGNVRVIAGKLEIGPDTIIEGDLTYRAKDVEIDPAAKVLGQTHVLPPRVDKDDENQGWAWGAVFGLTLLLGSLLVPAVLAIIFPRFIARAAGRLRTQFLPSLGLGAVAMLATPFVFGFLFLSILGVPLGLALMVLLSGGVVLGWAVGIVALGQQLRSWLQRKPAEVIEVERQAKSSLFLWTLLGALLAALLFWIPILGLLSWMIVLLLGLGALCGEIWRGVWT